MSSVLLRTSVSTTALRASGFPSDCVGSLSPQALLAQPELNSRTTLAFSTRHHQPQQQTPIPLGSSPSSPQSPFTADFAQQASLPSPSPTPATAAYEVLFVRHGQSTWNRDNRFIGWTDVPLTEQGLEEAREAGRVLAREGVKVDEVHTSLLKRCIKTAWTILRELGQEYTPVHCHWRLNERSYGSLVGLEKKSTVARHGVETVRTWRRSFDVRPPPQRMDDKYWPGKDKKYKKLLASGTLPRIPAAECLKDVKERAAAHWEEVVVPATKAGKRVVVVGHENNLRALFMHIDQVAPEDMLHVEIPRAAPLRYQFDAQMKPVRQAEPAPFLTGQFLISAEKVAAVKERDSRQVYDLRITSNLEKGSGSRRWVEEQPQQAKKEEQEEQVRRGQQLRLNRTGLSINALRGIKASWISLPDERGTTGASPDSPAAAAGTSGGSPETMKRVLRLFDPDQNLWRFTYPSL